MGAKPRFSSTELLVSMPDLPYHVSLEQKMSGMNCPLTCCTCCAFVVLACSKSLGTGRDHYEQGVGTTNEARYSPLISSRWIKVTSHGYVTTWVGEEGSPFCVARRVSEKTIVYFG
jgi:hypothetical protein